MTLFSKTNENFCIPSFHNNQFNEKYFFKDIEFSEVTYSPRWISWLVIASFSLVLLVNLIFVIFVFNRKKLRTGYNVLLVNVAIADITKSFLYFIFYSSFIMDSWEFGEICCSIVGVITLSYTFFIPFSLTILFLLSFFKSIQFDFAIFLSIFIWIASLSFTKFDSEVDSFEMSEGNYFTFCTVSSGFFKDNLDKLRWIFIFTHVPPLAYVIIQTLSKLLDIKVVEKGQYTHLAVILTLTSILFNEYLIQELNLFNYKSTILTSKHIGYILVYCDFLISFHRPFLYVIMKKDVKNEFKKMLLKTPNHSLEVPNA